jgi:MHS family proline/betaine transporter-like MFS transporter
MATQELSVLLMCVATVGMGCLPTYNQAGVIAPILLVVVRLMQGVSVGGELIGSIVYTTETAPSNRWGLYASFSLMTAVLGTALGMLVGAIMHASLSEDKLDDWGWRIPFLAGIVL